MSTIKHLGANGFRLDVVRKILLRKKKKKTSEREESMEA
jgi:uncharacterized protein (UPF0335 family)